MAARIRHLLTIPPIWTSVLVNLSPMDVVSVCIAFRIKMSEVERERRLNPVRQVLGRSSWPRCHVPHAPVCIFIGRDLVKPSAELSRNDLRMKRSSQEIVLLLVAGCLKNEGSTMLQCREEIISTLLGSGGVLHQPSARSLHHEKNQVVFFPHKATSIHVVNPQLNPAYPRSGIIYLETSVLEAFITNTEEWLIFQSYMPLQSTAVCKDSFVDEYFWWTVEHSFFLFRLYDNASTSQIPISLFLVDASGVKRLKLLEKILRTIRLGDDRTHT